jgi:hypothetical protein
MAEPDRARIATDWTARGFSYLALEVRFEMLQECTVPSITSLHVEVGRVRIRWNTVFAKVCVCGQQNS